MAEKEATVETTTEDVTLSSKEQEGEKSEVETENLNTNESEQPSEGDNTSEEEVDTSLSPRKERDLKRLNQLLLSAQRENGELKARLDGMGKLPEVKSYIPPQINTPNSELESVKSELARIKELQEHEIIEKWHTEDDDLWEKSMAKFPELSRYPGIVRQARVTAQIEQGSGWDHADYVKHLRSVAKELGLAEQQGLEKANEREGAIGSVVSPSSKNQGRTVERQFDSVKKQVMNKTRLTTADIADLMGALRT